MSRFSAERRLMRLSQSSRIARGIGQLRCRRKISRGTGDERSEFHGDGWRDRQASRQRQTPATRCRKAGQQVCPCAEKNHPAKQAEAREMSAGFDRRGKSNIAPTDAPARKPEPPSIPATLTHTEAKASGYTGSVCDTCGSSRMRMAGHCMVCEECGSTTGCS